jgi:hypothetical protein
LPLATAGERMLRMERFVVVIFAVDDLCSVRSNQQGELRFVHVQDMWGGIAIGANGAGAKQCRRETVSGRSDVGAKRGWVETMRVNRNWGELRLAHQLQKVRLAWFRVSCRPGLGWDPQTSRPSLVEPWVSPERLPSAGVRRITGDRPLSSLSAPQEARLFCPPGWGDGQPMHWCEFASLLVVGACASSHFTRRKADFTNARLPDWRHGKDHVLESKL